jgi:hypothetical protein
MVAGHPRLSRDKSLQRNGTIDLTSEERASVGLREVDRLPFAAPMMCRCTSGSAGRCASV